MTADPVALEMIRELQTQGHNVTLELHGDAWVAWCEVGGHTHYAKRETAINAIAALAESAGFDLE